MCYLGDACGAGRCVLELNTTIGSCACDESWKTIGEFSWGVQSPEYSCLDHEFTLNILYGSAMIFAIAAFGVFMSRLALQVSSFRKKGKVIAKACASLLSSLSIAVGCGMRVFNQNRLGERFDVTFFLTLGAGLYFYSTFIYGLKFAKYQEKRITPQNAINNKKSIVEYRGALAYRMSTFFPIKRAGNRVDLFLRVTRYYFIIAYFSTCLACFRVGDARDRVLRASIGFAAFGLFLSSIATYLLLTPIIQDISDQLIAISTIGQVGNPSVPKFIAAKRRLVRMRKVAISAQMFLLLVDLMALLFVRYFIIYKYLFPFKLLVTQAVMLFTNVVTWKKRNKLKLRQMISSTFHEGSQATNHNTIMRRSTCRSRNSDVNGRHLPVILSGTLINN